MRTFWGDVTLTYQTLSRMYSQAWTEYGGRWPTGDYSEPEMTPLPNPTEFGIWLEALWACSWEWFVSSPYWRGRFWIERML